MERGVVCGILGYSSMSSNSFFSFSISSVASSDKAATPAGGGMDGETGSSLFLVFDSKLFLLPTLLLPVDGLTVLGGVLVRSEGGGELVLALDGELAGGLLVLDCEP